jgi:DNA-binding winged helix-turn-helix (wHTH) protein/TolB-like protein
MVTSETAGEMGHMYRFGVYRFDTGQLELRRNGESVRLQRQPAQVLAVLIDHAGQLVTREQLRLAIWGSDTFVDFDRGLNFCIGQIRAALGDDAGVPRYVRTVPKKGYEFICPVEAEVPLFPNDPTPLGNASSTFARRAVVVATGLMAVVAAALAAYSRAPNRPDRPIIAVARFDNETGDPTLTRFSDYLTDTVVEQLTETSAGSYGVVGNAAILRVARERRDIREIGASLNANYVVLGQVQRDDGHVRVLGHLIRLPDQTHVSVARFDDVHEQTLATTSEIAVRMTERFARRLKEAQPPIKLER